MCVIMVDKKIIENRKSIYSARVEGGGPRGTCRSAHYDGRLDISQQFRRFVVINIDYYLLLFTRNGFK